MFQGFCDLGELVGEDYYGINLFVVDVHEYGKPHATFLVYGWGTGYIHLTITKSLLCCPLLYSGMWGYG